jgi:hypothetical protein
VSYPLYRPSIGEFWDQLEQAENEGEITPEQANLLGRRLEGETLAELAGERGVTRQAIEFRHRAALKRMGYDAGSRGTAL